jgi:hypothetical protein
MHQREEDSRILDALHDPGFKQRRILFGKEHGVWKLSIETRYAMRPAGGWFDAVSKRLRWQPGGRVEVAQND